MISSSTASIGCAGGKSILPLTARLLLHSAHPARASARALSTAPPPGSKNAPCPALATRRASTIRPAAASFPGPASLAPRLCTRLLSTTASNQSVPRLAPVPDRGVIEIKGRDTAKLLQGLISTNVRKLETGQQDLLYASFSNAQGRMLADVLIHRLPCEQGEQHWLLDLDKRVLPSLLSFIKRFKLRSKVSLKDASEEWKVQHLWSHAPPAELVGSHHDWVLSQDVRTPGMGYRAVVRSDFRLSANATVDEVGEEDYTVHRILQGVGEGSVDFPEAASVPLENNLDYMNGVDFRKGCYVGQELTARTHHTGVVRKRIIPLSFYLEGTPAPTSLELDPTFTVQLPPSSTEVRSRPISLSDPTDEAGGKPARGRAAGKFTTGVHNVGLGCLRLEQVARWQDPTAAKQQGRARPDALQFSFENQEGRTILVRPWIPGWWPEQPTSSVTTSDSGEE